VAGDVLSVAVTTDVNGRISGDLADSFAAVEWLAVKSASFPTGSIALGIWLVEAGKNYEYDIPTIEIASTNGSNIVKEI